MAATGHAKTATFLGLRTPEPEHQDRCIFFRPAPCDVQIGALSYLNGHQTGIVCPPVSEDISARCKQKEGRYKVKYTRSRQPNENTIVLAIHHEKPIGPHSVR